MLDNELETILTELQSSCSLPEIPILTARAAEDRRVDSWFPYIGTATIQL
ncbi:MAG: hypothetical protein QOI21_1565 [Actinomycetota bacterium]|jgi:hypothetical protein|nr:hypothetical protein [Actinomycetota bacterium]